MRQLDGWQYRPACKDTREVEAGLYSCVFITLSYTCWSEGIFGKYHGLGSSLLCPWHLCSDQGSRLEPA